MKRPLFLLILGILLATPLCAQESVDPVAQALHQGSVFESKRKYDLALESYRKADKLAHHGSAVCCLHIASVERKLGQLPEALEEAKRAEKLSGSDATTAVQAHFLRASVLVQLAGKPTDKKLKEAEEELHAALALDPQQALAHFNLGMILLRQGNDADGIAELKAYTASPHAKPETVAEAQRAIANPVRAREPFAPGFSFVTLENQSVNNASLRGRVVLLDFWGTWCEPCREAVPMLRNLQKKFAGPGFQLVGISSDDDEELVRTFAQAQHMDWQEHVDISGDLSTLFKIESVPTFIVIDKDGVIRFRQSGLGFASQSELEEVISKALKRPSDPALAAAALAGDAPAANPAAASGAVSAGANSGDVAPAHSTALLEVERATLSGNLYKNEALGIVYQLPAGWIAVRQEILHGVNERAEAAARAAILQQHPDAAPDVPISIPKVVLYTSKRGEGDGRRFSIPCLRILASPAPISELNPQVFQRMTESMAAASGMKVIRSGEAFTVQDHAFLRADFERESSSSKVYEAMVQTLAGSYLLQIEIFAGSQSDLQKIVDTLQVMTIAGD